MTMGLYALIENYEF